ncbi:MAG: D-aminoacyl-tRNA deacylase [Rubrobacter sp.]|nr:D-aminoacyl-tRNA deacylase [Rubrobacter sp.]
MNVVLQRVSRASVTVKEQRISHIGSGLLLLVGVAKGDDEDAADWLARKVAGLRVFADEEGKMNLSVADVRGSALAVSQFTLLGDARKGNRPSFAEAAPPEEAEPLFDHFCERLRAHGVPDVRMGSFGAMMDVELVNDGPVTLLLQR